MRRITIAVTAALLVAVSSALAGPPWLTVEIRPHGDVLLLVHTFHHGTPAPIPLSGSAEGLVSGRRVSVPLRFESTSDPTAFAVARTWGSDGVWVVNIASNGEHGGAGAVVGLDREGEAAFVRFPRRHDGVSRPATPREVDAMLRALDAGQAPPALARAGLLGLGTRLVLPLLLVGLGIAAVARLLSAGLRQARGRTAGVGG